MEQEHPQGDALIFFQFFSLQKEQDYNGHIYAVSQMSWDMSMM